MRRKNIYDKSGYVLVFMPDHPMHDSRGYVRQHRLVMEDYLKRILNNNEVVHHKNGLKDDNRIENLEILSPSEHMTHHSTVRRITDSMREKVRQVRLHESKETREKRQQSLLAYYTFNSSHLLGKKFSKETREKMSLARKRQKPPTLGMKHSKETKARMRDARNAYWQERRSVK